MTKPTELNSEESVTPEAYSTTTVRPIVEVVPELNDEDNNVAAGENGQPGQDEDSLSSAGSPNREEWVVDEQQAEQLVVDLQTLMWLRQVKGAAMAELASCQRNGSEEPLLHHLHVLMYLNRLKEALMQVSILREAGERLVVLPDNAQIPVEPILASPASASPARSSSALFSRSSGSSGTPSPSQGSRADSACSSTDDEADLSDFSNHSPLHTPY